MTTLSYAQLKGAWLQNATGKYKTNAWATLMAAIAEAESGGNTTATNPADNNGTQTSWGLFQISNGTHAQVSPDWTNPAEQVRLAMGKLNSQGLAAWGTYNSGAYKGFLSGKTAADVSGLSAGGSGGSDAAATAQLTAATNLQADCLWPAGARLGLPLGQSVSIPCLLTRSEARAVAAVGIMTVGAIIMGAGLAWIVKSAAIGAVSSALLPVLSKIPGGAPVPGKAGAAVAA